MNYINQIRSFWIKDIQYQFSDKEVSFYFYLLHICNSLRWKSTFGVSNKTVYAKFGWSRQTLSNIQHKLKEAELINYTQGLGRGNPYQYKLITDKEKTRKNKTEKSPILELPYHSDSFVKLWNSLLRTPKWREKPTNILQANLDKLKAYDEPFSIQLIEQTLLGNWQGLVFRDTDNQYRKWKAEQMNETNQSRRAEIIRRATTAAASCPI